MRRAAIAMTLLLAGCGLLPRPTIDCRLPAGCAQVIAAASELLPPGESRWLIIDGRSPPGASHAEVHACYRDGRYLLVDVFRGTRIGDRASIRDEPWPDPPCR